MVGMRASRPGSLRVQQSCDPGCGGAIRARALVAFPSELPGLLAFSCALCAERTVMVRTDLEQTLHRLTNHIECRLSEIFPELLAESRIEAVSSISWSGRRFVEALREVRDGKEGAE